MHTELFKPRVDGREEDHADTDELAAASRHGPAQEAPQPLHRRTWRSGTHVLNDNLVTDVTEFGLGGRKFDTSVVDPRRPADYFLLAGLSPKPRRREMTSQVFSLISRHFFRRLEAW